MPEQIAIKALMQQDYLSMLPKRAFKQKNESLRHGFMFLFPYFRGANQPANSIRSSDQQLQRAVNTNCRTKILKLGL